MFLYYLMITLLAYFVQCNATQYCWNHGRVIKVTKYTTSIQYKVCLHGVVQSKTIQMQSTGCLHVPHSLVRVPGSRFRYLRDNQCVGEDGKARKRGYGVVLGQRTLSCIPVLFEYCGTPQLDTCCKNVHNIKGPYSCLVYTVRGMSLKKHVLLTTGYQYLNAANQHYKNQNLLTSLQKLVQIGTSSFYGYPGRKRSSMSLFYHTKLQWL